MTPMDPPFAGLPDLASRRLGGSVVAANDELFAERENLIKAAEPAVLARTRSATRARSWTAGRPGAAASRATTGRSSGSACPASSAASSSTPPSSRGNYPPETSVEGAAVDGLPVARRAAGRRLDAAGRPLPRARRQPERLRGAATRPGSRTCGSASSRTAASPGCGSTGTRSRTRGSCPATCSTWQRSTTAAPSPGAATCTTPRPPTSSRPARPA